jgi:hypothetical protein
MPDMTVFQEPNPAPVAHRPAQIEPIFSTRQAETVQSGQTLTVSCYFPDGSHDQETESLGAYGAWIPAEEISECQERLERTLRRRHQTRLAESKPSDKP